MRAWSCWRSSTFCAFKAGIWTSYS